MPKQIRIESLDVLKAMRQVKEREESMKCGVCGDHYGELMVKHAELCEDDSKAEARPYAPEKTINDLIREREESNEG